MLRAYVDFSNKLRHWDGFGVSYSDADCGLNTSNFLQGFNGYSRLPPETRLQISDLFFGQLGLRPGIIRIFLDPFRQDYLESEKDEESPIDLRDYKFGFDISGVRQFCSDALRSVKKWGGDIKVVATCLSPPGWMTKQKELSGRDLDPISRTAFARYIVSWIKFLSEEYNFPIKFVSLHNFGELWECWTDKGAQTDISVCNAPNIYWPPEQVIDYLKLVRRMLDRNGLQQVGLTPGETMSWAHFHEWGYADALIEDPLALSSLNLLTSHNCSHFEKCKGLHDWRSAGVDLIRDKFPEIHAWQTSTGSSISDSLSVLDIHNSIYSSKVNAIITDAIVCNNDFFAQRDALISINQGGLWSINASFNYFKSLCRAGQPGMNICKVVCNGSQIILVGFSSNTTRNPDSFVVANSADSSCELPIEIRGSASNTFSAFRTSSLENYIRLETIPVREGRLTYRAPGNSVTSFFGNI
jgi:O-glycosyl hydrolase